MQKDISNRVPVNKYRKNYKHEKMKSGKTTGIIVSGKHSYGC